MKKELLIAAGAFAAGSGATVVGLLALVSNNKVVGSAAKNLASDLVYETTKRLVFGDLHRKPSANAYDDRDVYYYDPRSGAYRKSRSY